MSSFTEELTITHMDANWKLWRLERDFTYEVGDKGSGRKIVVPRGFMVDGASVPQFLWNILPAWGQYSRAAVIHDYLCYRLNDGRPHPEGMTRKITDDVFNEAMEVCNTNRVVRWFMYAGVRIGAVNWPFSSTNIVSSANPPGL